MMNRDLIEKWNSKVDPDDTVFHLGDFGFGRNGKQELLQSILNELNGKKILIEGNHDRGKGKKLVGWEYITKYEELTLNHTDGNRYYIRMFHYPIESWNDMHHGSIMLHGHCHDSLPGNNQRLDVGTDSWDGYPVTFDEILERLKTLPPCPFNDHHRPE